MSEKRKYDSTVARMAGNIAAGMIDMGEYWEGSDLLADHVAFDAVKTARAIVAETERTEPRPETPKEP